LRTEVEQKGGEYAANRSGDCYNKGKRKKLSIKAIVAKFEECKKTI